MKSQVHILLCLAATMFSLASCNTIGGYNARAHEQLTGLKARHAKIIEDNTEGAGKVFSVTKLAQDTDSADLAFREAEEFAQTLGDATRIDNLGLLHDIFKLAAARIAKKGALLNSDQATMLNETANRAYALAIKGETVRNGGS